MSEDGGSKSRSESMLDVARGLSASLQNIRRYTACACGVSGHQTFLVPQARFAHVHVSLLKWHVEHLASL